MLHPAGGEHLPVVRGDRLYEIRVRGRLSEATLASFDGMTAGVAPAQTVLRGTVPHEARLHQLLRRVEALGLELVEVRRLPRG
jgi:hypothetical protein